jgi:hypothetical protein
MHALSGNNSYPNAKRGVLKKGLFFEMMRRIKLSPLSSWITLLKIVVNLSSVINDNSALSQL